MEKGYLKLFILLLCILLISACSSAEKIQHIEVFVTKTTETTGYKKVNAITSIEDGKNYIKTDIKAVEDFYDADGTYIKTKIIHSYFNKSKVTRAEEGEERKEELHKPSTILLPDDVLDQDPNIEHFNLDNMTKEEKEKVKEHVLSFMDVL